MFSCLEGCDVACLCSGAEAVGSQLSQPACGSRQLPTVVDIWEQLTEPRTAPSTASAAGPGAMPLFPPLGDPELDEMLSLLADSGSPESPPHGVLTPPPPPPPWSFLTNP